MILLRFAVKKDYSNPSYLSLQPEKISGVKLILKSKMKVRLSADKQLTDFKSFTWGRKCKMHNP